MQSCNYRARCSISGTCRRAVWPSPLRQTDSIQALIRSRRHGPGHRRRNGSTTSLVLARNVARLPYRRSFFSPQPVPGYTLLAPWALKESPFLRETGLALKRRNILYSNHMLRAHGEQTALNAWPLRIRASDICLDSRATLLIPNSTTTGGRC